MLIITIGTGIKILLNSNSKDFFNNLSIPSDPTDTHGFSTRFQTKTEYYFQIIIVKTVSLPAMEEAFRLPPCIRIIWREMLSPMPDPSSLVVKKGTNISFMISGGMPGPLSRTRINTLPVAPCSAERVMQASALPRKA